MQIPNCERAIVDIVKLRDYCLNLDHIRGRHKARVFLNVLGPLFAVCGLSALTKAFHD